MESFLKKPNMVKTVNKEAIDLVDYSETEEEAECENPVKPKEIKEKIPSKTRIFPTFAVFHGDFLKYCDKSKDSE